MNRRELLRELSRVQATWVNRNTPGAGDVDVTAEAEQDYLTRISAVFERAREDVRRKRRAARVADARAAARAAIGMLMAFDPNQPRDREGKWTEVRTTPPIDVDSLPAIPGLREQVTGVLTAAFNSGQRDEG